MKKKLLSLLLLSLSLALASCNKQVFDFKYNFTKVHVFEKNRCYSISSWTDYEDSDQIQVTIPNYGACLFYSNQIVLIESKCPFCE